jgi:hypothetical protein
LSGGKAETVIDDLQSPQGLAVNGDLLYIVNVGARELIEFDMASGRRHSVAVDLPVGAPPGVIPKFLNSIGDMSGPMGPFAGIAAGANGTLYLSADADGSLLALRPMTVRR